MPSRELSAFHRLLSPRQQRRLVARVALWRGPALRAAWPQLRAVGAGYRSRRDADGHERILTDEPCVHLFVDGDALAAGGARTRLPAELPARLVLDGRSVHCAVPTDVQALPAAVSPQHALDDGPPFGIAVGDAGAEVMYGVATCALRRPREPERSYLLSCRHVLGRTALDGFDDRSGIRVALGAAGRGTVVASTTSIRGRIGDASRGSFDAQLADVDPLLIDQALQGIAFDGSENYLRDPGDVGLGYWIATGRRDEFGHRLLVWVDHVGFVVGFRIPYQLPGGGTIAASHELLLRGRPSVPIRPGDSGSPALATPSGQRLVGMLIASGETYAYVIPAWQLLSPLNYGRPGEARWQLLP